jgi:hypothetical protein
MVRIEQLGLLPIQHQIGLIAYLKDIVLRYTNKNQPLAG